MWMGRWRWLRWPALLALIIAGAEVAARFDDWIHDATPLTASPSRERDLVVAEPWGYRGRPHGVFRKWRLNAFGFRGPEIEPAPRSNRTRILLLGASETFGLFEAAGQEYPAVLRKLLGASEEIEVVNAAMAGISLISMGPYWDHWASKFSAKHIVFYPSPMFYLDAVAPALPMDPRIPPDELRPRVLDRARDVYHGLPTWAKALREQWVIDRQLANQPADWMFEQVPAERLEQFVDDVHDLVRRIRKDGAEPILVTHAHSATWPIQSEDEAHLRSMRMFFPRATPATLIAFEHAANDALRELGRREQVKVIDAAPHLSGRREWFADLVHFNDAGAAEMARVLAEGLREVTVSGRAWNSANSSVGAPVTRAKRS